MERTHLSEEISKLKALIEVTSAPKEIEQLEKQKKDLQYQALFYLEKIYNLECSDMGDSHEQT